MVLSVVLWQYRGISPEAEKKDSIKYPVLLERIGERYGVAPAKVLGILRQTAFKVKHGDEPFSDEEMAAGLILADRYGLDPFALIPLWAREF